MTTPSEPSPADLRRRLEELEKKLGDAQRELLGLRGEYQSLRNALLDSENAAARPAEAAPPTGEFAGREDDRRRGREAVGDEIPVLLPAEAPPRREEVPPREQAPPVPAASGKTREPEVAPAGAQAPPAPGAPPSTEPAGAEPSIDLETRIGSVWFLRLGLAAITIGVVFFAHWVDRRMEPVHKVGACYLASAALFALGWFFEKKLSQFARPVMASGLGLGFFTSFAAGYLKAMTCVSEEASIALMSASVLTILVCATLWRSESIAGLAIFFGHLAANAAAGEQDVFSLVAILFLSGAALGLCLFHNWTHLGCFAVIAAFVSHFFWALQPHPETTLEKRFWVNFSFFSAYYGFFLVADLVVHHRLWVRRKESLPALRRLTGRCIGPAALILYATACANLFRDPKLYDLYWGSIDNYLFVLAALQAVVAVYHRSRRSPETPFYATAATVLLTLGLFAWRGGLTLNLALAAEALLLLVLARRLRLWFLQPLAQAVLGVNFIHFCVSTVSEPTDWPLYLGSAATAFVYFVTAWMEETWKELPADERLPERPWMTVARRFFEGVMVPLAYVHALLGAVMAAHICGVFFGVPLDLAAGAILGTAVLFFVLCLRSSSLMLALWTIQGACCYFVLSHWSGGAEVLAALERFPLEQFWLIEQASVAGLAAGAWVALGAAHIWRRGFFRVVGLGSLALAAPAAWAACVSGNPTPWLVPLWVLPPLVFWVEAEAWGGRSTKGLVWSDGGWGALERWLENGRWFLCPLLAVAGALLTVRVTTAALPLAVDLTAVWVLSALTLFLLGLVVWRGSLTLLVGLLAHLAQMIVLLGSNQEEVAGEELLGWSLVTACVLTASVLAFASLWRKRASFGLGAWASLALGFVGVGVLLYSEERFTPFVLWLAVSFGFWVAVEVLRLGFAASPAGADEGERFQDWNDRVGLELLRQARTSVSVFFSLAGAALLFAITCSHFEDPPGVWTVMAALYAIASLVAAGVLRSPSLAGGYALFLSAAYSAYLFKILPLGGVVEYPYLSLFLVLAALLAGVAVEVSFRYREDERTSTQRAWAVLGTSHAYVLAFVLGSVLFHHRAGLLLEQETLGFPAQMLYLVLAFVVGSVLRLGWLQLKAFAFSIVAGVAAILDASDLIPWYGRQGLLVAGLLTTCGLLAMERIACWQHPETLARVGTRVGLFLRSALILAGAAQMLVVLSFSEGIQGTLTTLGWSLTALLLMALGFLWKSRAYRRTAIAVFGLSLLRIVVVDVVKLDIFYRMLAFLSVGLCFLAVSFLYSRFQEEIKKWL